MTFGTAAGMTVEWLHFSPEAIALGHRLTGCRGIINFERPVAIRWKPACKLIPILMNVGTLTDTCRVHAMLLELVALVLEKLPEENMEEKVLFRRLQPALKLLEKVDTDPPSLATLAQTAALSPEYFHRLFRAVFHISPYRYALARRMNLAQQLLSEGRHPVSIVAERCGYKDPFYFSRIFRQHFGIAPSKVLRGQYLSGIPGLEK